MRGTRHPLQAFFFLLLTHLPLWPTGLAFLTDPSALHISQTCPGPFYHFLFFVLATTRSFDLFSTSDANGPWPAYRLGPIIVKENINYSSSILRLELLFPTA